MRTHYDKNGVQRCVNGHDLGVEGYEQPGKGLQKCRACARRNKRQKTLPAPRADAAALAYRSAAFHREDTEKVAAEYGMLGSEGFDIDHGDGPDQLVTWFNPTPADVERAVLMYKTGDAEKIRNRYRTFTREDCAELVGRNVSTINTWFAGTGAPQHRYRHLATCLLLAIEEDAAEHDLLLGGHGYPKTRTGDRRHSADIDAAMEKGESICRGTLGGCRACLDRDRGDYRPACSTTPRLTDTEAKNWVQRMDTLFAAETREQ